MSVSFLEPDLDKLKSQLHPNSAIHENSDDELSSGRSHSASGRVSGLKPALARSSSSNAVLGAHSHHGHSPCSSPLIGPARFSTEATINNTNSNSLLFRRRHSEDLPNISFSSEAQKRSSSRRRIPTAGSRSNSRARSRSRDVVSTHDSRSTQKRRSSSVDIPNPSSPSTGNLKIDGDSPFHSDDDDDVLIEDLEDTPFFKRVAFDTINIDYHDPPSSGFRFSKPSLSSVTVGNWSSSSNDDTFNSFSISSKHEEYQQTYGSRTFLCALSSVSTSWRALKWLVERVMEDGDELLCLKVEKETSKSTEYYKTKSEETLTQIVHTIVDSKVKKINIVVELCLGSVRHIVRQAVLLYQPAIVIVGTSLKQYQKVMRYMSKKNTLSNFFINHSPVPVIVVVQEMVDKQEKLHETPKYHLQDIMDMLKARKKAEESDPNISESIPVITISSDASIHNEKPAVPLSNQQPTDTPNPSEPVPKSAKEDIDSDDQPSEGFKDLLPKERQGSAIAPYDYLTYLTARKNIEIDYNDDDTRQTYRSLFADWDKEGNFINSATNSPKTVPHTGVDMSTTNTSKSTATTVRGTESSSSLSDPKPSTSSANRLNFGYQLNKKKTTSTEDECDPRSTVFSPTTLLSPSKSVPNYGGSNSTLGPNGVPRPDVKQEMHNLSPHRTISSIRSSSATPVSSADGSDGAKSKRKKSFFGSFMRRKSQA